ncbi:DUF3592 domain-containing protein [Pyxidicoccus sp. 3LFB2]
MFRENPSVRILTGLVLLTLGLVIGGELLQGPSGSDDPTVARPLHSRTPAAHKPRASPGFKLVGFLAFTLLGAGMSLHGFRQAHRQGLLLRDGVPVTGRVIHIQHVRKRSSTLTYRFVDEAGQVREGVYSTHFAGGPLDELQVGAEVTVVYDAADSRKHTLDVDHVRRADAALRRL